MKETILKKFGDVSMDADSLFLIFAGKVIKNDQENLQELEIKVS